MPNQYQPLKIMAWLQTPVISDALLMLDGIILYLAMRQTYGPQDASQSGRGGFDEPAQLRKIFWRHADREPHWFPACSAAQWSTPIARDTGYWHKRFDLQHADLLQTTPKRLETGAGRYRSYRMPVFVRHALSITWYAVAQRERLEHLLPFATHLGKKISQGYGAILRWEIVPFSEDWSIYGSHDQRMRPVPIQFEEAMRPAEAILHGYRPAYWDQRNQGLCYLPN